jgi:hypothetical protein
MQTETFGQQLGGALLNISDEQRGGKENHQQAALIRANRKAHNVSQMGESCIDWFHVMAYVRTISPLTNMIACHWTSAPQLYQVWGMPYDIFIPP